MESDAGRGQDLPKALIIIAPSCCDPAKRMTAAAAVAIKGVIYISKSSFVSIEWKNTYIRLSQAQSIQQSFDASWTDCFARKASL